MQMPAQPNALWPSRTGETQPRILLLLRVSDDSEDLAPGIFQHGAK